MDPVVGISAVLALPASLLCYAIYAMLTREWARVRALEGKLQRPDLEQAAERLASRADALAESLKESAQGLDQKVDRLEREHEEQGRRLVNLEAVVVGQVRKTLDQGHTGTVPREAPDGAVGKTSEKKRNRRRVAKLANLAER